MDKNATVKIYVLHNLTWLITEQIIDYSFIDYFLNKVLLNLQCFYNKLFVYTFFSFGYCFLFNVTPYFLCSFPNIVLLLLSFTHAQNFISVLYMVFEL